MLSAGAVIGSYEIVSPIAGGGMGMVYRARHVALGREVALKVLLPNLAMSERVQHRFRQEAYVQGQLEHANIVQVTDFVQQGDLLGLVMQLVQGPSLDTVLEDERSGPWPLDETMAVMGPVLEAVAYAHGRGVVHRDLKPANVLLDRRDGGFGVPKLTDFGLGKILTSEQAFTRTGAQMGTVPYMAPEQFRGTKDISARADVFALGMLLWRLLAGRLPFDPSDQVALLQFYTGQLLVPPLAGVALGVSQAMSSVVDEALAMVPDGRPADAGALRQRVAEALQAEPAAPPAQAVPAAAATQAVQPGRDNAAVNATRPAVPTAPDLGEATEPPAPGDDSSAPPAAPRRTVAPVAASVAAGLLVAGLVAAALWPERGGDGRAPVAAEAAVPATRTESLPDAPAAPSSANPAGLTWVELPAGTYQMGSQNGDEDEKPLHDVRVPAFEMAKSETTVAEYRLCVEGGPCGTPARVQVAWGDSYNWGAAGRDLRPVNGVNWEQSRTFCAWAAGRLCSESEWEYAARSGGLNWAYPWGDEKASCARAVMNDGSRTGCGRDTTWPVCAKEAGNTTQGVCDLAGNVWEWVEDCYHNTYRRAPDDGSTWTDTGDQCRSSFRVRRGGGFDYGASNLRAGYRGSDSPGYASASLGFRCCRSKP